jgi:hypothetical protein
MAEIVLFALRVTGDGTIAVLTNSRHFIHTHGTDENVFINRPLKGSVHIVIVSKSLVLRNRFVTAGF